MRTIPLPLLAALCGCAGAAGAPTATPTAAAQTGTQAPATSPAATATQAPEGPTPTGDAPTPAASPAPSLDRCAEHLAAAEGQPVSASCDEGWLYASSADGLPAQAHIPLTMVGITSWIQRLPVPFPFDWKIPRDPVWQEAVTAASPRGPIAIAVDGVPIFHYERRPDGSTALADYQADSDTVVQGELDACGGHAGQGDDYHYHYAPVCLLAGRDLSLPIAYGLDGAPVYFGEAGSDFYGGGAWSDVSRLPAQPLDDCNALQRADGSWVHYTTKTPPYVIGCHHGVVDPDLQIEPRPMSGRDQGAASPLGGELGEPASTHVTAFSKDGDGFRMEFDALDGSGKTSAILYHPVSDSPGCWSFDVREDKEQAGVTSVACRSELSAGPKVRPSELLRGMGR